MEKEKKENPLRKFIEESNINLNQFSKISGIHYSGLYAIYRGISWPRLQMAKRICSFTNGKLTKKDFGYEKNEPTCRISKLNHDIKEKDEKIQQLEKELSQCKEELFELKKQNKEN